MEKWTLIWTGLFPLNETSVKTLQDNLAGVYRLSYQEKDNNYYIFYIGQSQDIKKRLLQHLSNSESNVCIKNYLSKKCAFKYAQVTKELIRNAAEKQMYKKYVPSCNTSEPEGRDDIIVNLS